MYDADISVNACNSDNASTSDLKVTAYCAILQSGIQNDWNWDWAPGAFLNSLGDISGYTSKDNNNNDVYHYWSWSLDGVEGATALNQYELQLGNIISLNFIDPVKIITPVEENHSSSGSRSKKEEKKIFDITKALDFLISQQKENGSFGEDLYTDWIAVSIASIENQKIKPVIELTKYFAELKSSNTLLTDFERHAIALMALGLNPYNTNGENYIKKITDNFDGQQFGDIEKDNDDIFALLILQNAGYTEKEKIMIDGINYILTKQKENGSWDESIDMTGAAIQAIAIFTEENFLLRGVSQVDEPRGSAPLASGDSNLGKERFFSVKIQDALLKAKEFLKQNQKEDGGFGNVSSTTWVIGGILALSEKPEDWIKNKNTPLDYLALNQDTDGGIKNENLQNKIWETAYTLTALSGKTWNQIMQKFEKPKEFITIEEKAILEVKIEKILTLLENKRNVERIEKTNTLAKIKSKEKNTINPNINTANVINSLENNNNVEKDGWLKSILTKIFNIF